MTAGHPRALVVGEALTDVIVDVDGTREFPGGSPLNLSFGLARLGMDVSFLTRLGDDERGRAIERHLSSAGVVVTRSASAGSRTSVATAVLDESGSASYEFDIEWALPSVLPPLGEVDVLHIGSIGALLDPGARDVAALVTRLRPTATISYDPNIRPQLLGRREDVLARVEALVALSDVVKASDEDLAWLYPAVSPLTAAERWLALGPALVVVTRGSRGSLARTRDNGLESPSLPVTVVDTIGAGDSFMAGLLSGLGDAGLLGAPRRQALRAIDETTLAAVIDRATACAAITVSRAGAQPPWRAELAD